MTYNEVVQFFNSPSGLMLCASVGVLLGIAVAFLLRLPRGLR